MSGNCADGGKVMESMAYIGRTWYPMMECERCDGTGWEDGYCPSCNGSGEGMTDGSTCRSCRGSGESRRECQECEGSGEVIDKIAYLNEWQDANGLSHKDAIEQIADPLLSTEHRTWLEDYMQEFDEEYDEAAIAAAREKSILAFLNDCTEALADLGFPGYRTIAKEITGGKNIS